jgi:hypothetical protein
VPVSLMVPLNKTVNVAAYLRCVSVEMLKCNSGGRS